MVEIRWCVIEHVVIFVFVCVCVCVRVCVLNAVTNSLVLHLFLQLDSCNMVFKILIIVQRDATLSRLIIILQVHSTCFGC